MWTVSVLGPVGLRRDGVPLAVPAGKTTEVLIRLALDAGELVRTDRLIDDLWAGQSTGVARNTLQAKVSKLRRALGEPGLLTGGTAGYTLHVDPACVDVAEVLRLAGTVTSLRSAGDLAGARDTAAAALALFHGELLPDAGDGDWLAPHRSRLEELRLRLTEDQLSARIALGATAQAIGDLEALVLAHPLREGLWRLLITALAAAGRQADALGAYARVRELLAEELGLDPGPELRSLQQRILRQEEAPRTGNLPGLTAELFGRDADLSAVAALTAAHRLVTVVGPAGVGKTRLAIEAGRAAGGGWLVRLDSRGSIWQNAGDALGVGEATESMVLDRLRGLDALLVLDNCEHVVDQAGPAAERMLAVAPGLRILATSQLPLGLAGETVHELAPLALTDSVALFRDRAVKQRRSFGADGDEATLAAVCRALDGLPLAIELAAARAKVLSAQEIARRLDDRFTLLHDPTSRLPARQRTLHSAIGWSYDLLFPDDQRGLWALACFSDGAPLAGAESVLAALEVPAAAAMDVIGRLADRSLAAVEVGPGGTVRYRLLDSVREFGREKLRESGLADVALGAHAASFGAAAERVGRGIRGADQAAHLTTVRTERANIDAALAWATEHDPVLALRTANGFGWAWVFLGAGRDAAERSRAVLAAAGPEADVADRVDGLLFAGWFEASGGDLDRAVADVREAIAIADTPELRSRARLIKAFTHSQQGRPREALAELAARAEALAEPATPAGDNDAPAKRATQTSHDDTPAKRATQTSHDDALGERASPAGGDDDAPAEPAARAGDDDTLSERATRTSEDEAPAKPAVPAGDDDAGAAWEEGAAWLLAAWAEVALGEVGRGRAASDEALRRLAPLGDRWALSHAEALLGALAQAEHRFGDATGHLARAADAAHRLGFLAAGSLHRANLGRAHELNGDRRAAALALQAAIATARTAGDLRIVALAQVRLARVWRALGDRPAARALLDEAQRWYATAGGGDGALLADHLAAALDADAGEPHAADRLAGVLDAARRAGDAEVEVLTLDRLARVHVTHGHADQARELHLLAEARLRTAQPLVTAADRIDGDSSF